MCFLSVPWKGFKTEMFSDFYLLKEFKERCKTYKCIIVDSKILCMMWNTQDSHRSRLSYFTFIFLFCSFNSRPPISVWKKLDSFFKGVALKSQTWAEILHFGYQNFGPLIFILYDPISIEQLEADINRYFYFLLSSTC